MFSYSLSCKSYYVNGILLLFTLSNCQFFLFQGSLFTQQIRKLPLFQQEYVITVTFPLKEQMSTSII